MTVVDLSFPIRGPKTIPRDHGYLLYSALSRALPILHGAAWLGVHPISGRAQGAQLELQPRSSVRLRVPSERIAELLSLSDAGLAIGGASIQLAPPRVYPLVPAASLDARLVVVRLTSAPRAASKALDVRALEAGAVEELQRQLAQIGIERAPIVCGRSSLSVSNQRIVGFAIRVAGLDAESSHRLQERGLGGKRRMGCGIFRPTRGRRL